MSRTGTAECVDWDYSQAALVAVDRLADDFEFLRYGYLDATEDEVIGAVQAFVERYRDESIVRLLEPVIWAEASE